MQEYASHVPLPDSDLSISELGSDVDFSAGLSNSSKGYVDVQSWLPEPSKDSVLGLAGSLFEATLALFITLARCLAGDKDIPNYTIESKELLKGVERLFLWGDGFSASSGQLDDILSKSSELQQTVLSTLYELGVTLRNTAIRTCYSSGSHGPRGLDVPMRELQGLLEQTSILLYGSDGLDDKDTVSESGSSTSDLSECIEDISTYIDCLMDLSLALEDPVVDVETVDAAIPIFQDLETFDVSSPQALAFCRKIRDRFPKLEKWLVERLGENNARRASSLNEARDRSLDIEAIMSEIAKWTIDEPEESVFPSEALFSDSQPKPTETTRSTNLSNSVFDKSNPDSFRRLAPPSKPARRVTHVPASNASFTTFASFSTKASAISEDLSPYSCTVRTCDSGTKLYSSTRTWVEHEAQHRLQDWQGTECPFCDKQSSLMSPQSYYKHVGEHLREISLAALPHSSDSDVESSSSDDKSEDGDDWATVPHFPAPSGTLKRKRPEQSIQDQIALEAMRHGQRILASMDESD
ncbi:unnamed protein product [Fusarium venenatum]|uniref:C2H2-type domain-containing protein n=1 Tax=Fusarium venenatum TaxID=56646 RepID=A0A2L2TRT7_9HYPO|nr:uncharacterized protein FVRRES_00202 [Fusarium venenatum]CEI63690.1 unnamed protein product [Fusarium venenatum]